MRKYPSAQRNGSPEPVGKEVGTGEERIVGQTADEFLLLANSLSRFSLLSGRHISLVHKKERNPRKRENIAQRRDYSPLPWPVAATQRQQGSSRLPAELFAGRWRRSSLSLIIW